MSDDRVFMKLKLIGVALGCFTTAFAIPVIMPSEEVLNRRFEAIIEGHFNQKTRIAAILAGQLVESDNVVVIVDEAVERYTKYMGEPSTANIMQKKKPLLLKVLLKDFPEILKDLAKRGLYAPLDESLWEPDLKNC